VSPGKPPTPIDRDPALDAAWRTHSAELPPREIDVAILAAAHREAASRPRAAGDDDSLAEAREPSRWWWGLAAAATIGAIAFGLVQLAPFETAQGPMRASDMPSNAGGTATFAAPAAPSSERQAAPQPAAPPDVARDAVPAPASRPKVVVAPAPEPKAVPAPAPLASRETGPPQPAAALQRDDAPRARSEPDVSPPAPPASPTAPAAVLAVPDAPVAESTSRPHPFPGAAPAPAAKAEGATAPQRERAQAADSIARRPTPSAQAPREVGRAASAERATAARAPEDFVRRIRELHDAGRLEDAARELAAFREAWPDADAALPAELRAWAASVRK